jgi:hypothetical protein
MDARHAGALVISKSHGRSRCAAQAAARLANRLLILLKAFLVCLVADGPVLLDQDYRLTITGQQHQALR